MVEFQDLRCLGKLTIEAREGDEGGHMEDSTSECRSHPSFSGGGSSQAMDVETAVATAGDDSGNHRDQEMEEGEEEEEEEGSGRGKHKRRMRRTSTHHKLYRGGRKAMTK